MTDNHHGTTMERQVWLRNHAEALRNETLDRALNLLPDEHEIDQLMGVLIEAVGEGVGGRLRLAQSWADTNVGPDPTFANDWLAVLRTIKEVIADTLAKEFETAENLAYFREYDRILTYMIIEVTKLASDVDRAELLDHMVDLRQRMARLEQNKASFIKVAAHELRTPLTLLQGYATMMHDMSDPDVAQLQLMMNGIDSGISRLKSIINDMIDVTLIDAETIHIHYQPLYLDKMISMVLDVVKSQSEGRQVQFLISSSPLKGPIYADPERLFQALEKILANGMKYTPDGGKVYIRSYFSRPTEKSNGSNGFITIEVKDTGIGIDPVNLERIFEVFSGIHDFTLHSSGKSKFKGGGPGLGLPIARGIIEAHGGRLWADSSGCDETACPGSTFYIDLPLRTSPPGAVQ
ncbi:MAG: HAMP domain-containing sensor histidine kinase [Candidatus Promineifilaceae bacterium]